MFRLNVTILEESVRVSQVLLDRSPSMTGRKRGLDSEVPSKKLYRCNAVGCAVTPCGCDLPNHYQTKTNWEKVKKLRATMGTSALEKQLEAADPHTRFCYQQGYTEQKLPRWESHVFVKVNVVSGEGGERTGTGHKQSKLTDLFQVKMQLFFYNNI